jgi:hypothetical protein
MMQLRFIRDTTAKHGHFASTRTFTVDAGIIQLTGPVYLCSGATTRLFKLPPKSKRCVAKFTKKPPKNCHKYYSLKKRQEFYGNTVELEEYSGAFIHGSRVEAALEEAYNKGYRFVRIEP